MFAAALPSDRCKVNTRAFWSCSGGTVQPRGESRGLIYVSGTLAQDDKGALVAPGDVAAQTRRIIERMRECSSASGSSLDAGGRGDRLFEIRGRLPGDERRVQDVLAEGSPDAHDRRSPDLLLGADVEISMIAVPKGAERARSSTRDDG